MGKDPPCLPPGEWDVLWLTPIGAVGSLCPFRRITQALRNGRAQDRSETLTRGVWHERPRTAAGNCRLLPAHRACGIDLRPACRQRRQAHRAAAQRRPHHDRDARPHPRLHGQQPHGRERRASRDHRAAARAVRRRVSGFVAAASLPGSAIRSATSASSTTGRNICCSSTPAARSGWWRSRVSLELANIHPRPPALRVFDAGVGDGTVLLRVMRAMHDRFPHTPFYVVGKEISLEDVRLALQKMSDRFFEHPATVLVLTNLAYADAPWLAVKSLSRRLQHGVARSAADRQFGATASSSRSPIWCRSSSQNWKAGRQRQDRQSGLRAAGRAGDLSRGPQVPARSDHPEAGRHGRQLRPGHRLAALSRARLARLQGQARDRAAGARARAGRPADRHPFARQRSRHGDHPEGMAGRQSVHPRPPPDHEGGEARARPRRPRPQLQRLRRQPLAVSLRHAHAAERDFGIVDRHLDAVRGLERRDLRGAGRGRPARRRSPPTAAISTRRARCCASTAGCGSTTNPT